VKKQHFIVKYQVYPYELMVICGYGYDEVEIILKKKLPVEYHEEIGILNCDSMATAYMFSCGVTVIHFKDEIPEGRLMEIIVHESFHAVKLLMDTIGQTLTDDSEESYAYLLQFITSKIFAKLK
jgi:hypothetical protein